MFLRLGAVKGTLLVTLVSVLLSWAITLIAMSAMQMQADFVMGLAIATVCPLLIAPPVTYVVLTLLARLNHAEKLARNLAKLDPLTGVLNRTFFFRSFSDLLDNKRFKHSLALLLIDLDFFKLINDKLGHIEGDKVLIRICRCIESQLTEDEFIGRFGGDEFVVCIHSNHIDTTRARAQQIADACAQEMRRLYPEIDHPLSVSIGASQSDALHHQLQSLLDSADKNLYQAKQAGRARVAIS